MTAESAAGERRWMAVGRGGGDDSSTAGRVAATEAVRGADPALLILFCPVRHDLGEVSAAVREVAGPGVPLVGCTTAGEIAGDDAGSLGVVVACLGGRGFSVATDVAGTADGMRLAGAAAAGAIHGVDAPHRVLLMFSDGLAGDRLDLLRGAYGVAGANVPIAGGCAGDDLAMERTYQFHGDDVLTDMVVAAAIGSDAPFGLGIGHGFESFGEPIVVTETTGAAVVTLDNKPALDVYLDRLGAPPDHYHDPATWRRFSLLFGLQRPQGQEVRCVRGADYVERTLLCPDVPQGTLIRAMRGDAAAVMSGTDTAVAQALEGLEGHPPIGLLAFDCAARRAILGEDRIRAEVAAIRAHAPGVPLGGLYTMGEFGRAHGSRGVHNTTLVVLALA